MKRVTRLAAGLRWPAAASVTVSVLLAISRLPAAAQIEDTNVPYASGQNVAPVFEGWERVADGSFLMVFGYLNRNFEETPYVPIGPNNRFEPGDLDRGQPTFFLTRRHAIVFKVAVPKDWGNKDLVWTLTVNGHTAQAHGHLRPDWEIDDGFYGSRTGFGKVPNNKPPSVSGTSTLTAAAGQPLALAVHVSDDGLPVPRARRRPTESSGPVPGLRVEWVQYRGGPDNARLTPPMAPVTAGVATATAVFTQPGTYTVRAYADDGILITSYDISVTVTPASSATAR